MLFMLCVLVVTPSWVFIFVDPCHSFREAVQDDNKPMWERQGPGLTLLDPDTEVVQNINVHRYNIQMYTCTLLQRLLGNRIKICCPTASVALCVSTVLNIDSGDRRYFAQL